MPDLSFICHSSLDIELANRIVNKLESAGIPCWIAPRNIPPGLPYAASIIDGIRNSKYLIFIFTKVSISSDAVINEIEYANNLKIQIIPFRIHNLSYSDSLEYYLRSKQAINAHDRPLDEAINELVNYINSKNLNTVNSPRPILPPGENTHQKNAILKYILSIISALLLVFIVARYLGFIGPVQHNNYNENNKSGNIRPDSGSYLTDEPNTPKLKCQPETIDFTNGNNTIFQADFTVLSQQKNEYGNVQPSQFGNVYEMEAYSNTWIGLPAPEYYLKLNKSLDNDFIFNMWFKIKEGRPTIHCALSDDGVNYYKYGFYLEVWDKTKPTYSTNLELINANYAQVSKQFAERQKISDCVASKINWNEMNQISVKRENETIKYYLNNYLLQTFQNSAFPIKKIAISVAGKSKIDITSAEAKISQ